MKRTTMTIAALLIGATVSTESLAVVPDLIPLQGVLADDVGNPITDVVVMTFRMYDSEGASSAIWTEAQSVTVNDGFFTVYMGDVTDLPSDFPTYSEVWLGVTVDSDPEMDRFQLGAVPYALEAQRCEQVGSLSEDDINTNFAPASAGVPAGAVMFFNLASCPAGWSPLSAAQGRVAVGVPPGWPVGTSGQVGAAFSSAGSTRTIDTVPSHIHPVDPVNQSVAVAGESSHTHSVTINPTSFTMGAADGSHTHTASSASDSHDHDIRTEYSGGYGTFGVMGTLDNAGGSTTASPILNDSHSHTITVNSTNSSHVHTIDVPSTTNTSAGGSSHSHSASFDMSAFDSQPPSGSPATVDVTMPYVQLLVCVKD